MTGESVNRSLGESEKQKNINRYSPIHLFTICIAFLILTFAFSASSFAEVASSSPQDIYEQQLDAGLKNNEPYSYVLIKKSRTDPSNARSLLTEALRHSPDLPAVYFEMSKASFSLSSKGVFESIGHMVEGFKAYGRNFWWQTSLAGLLFISLISSFIIALFAVICTSFFMEIPLLSHEIKEDKKKALLVLSLIPLSLPGALFFIAGALFLLGLYFKKTDKAVVYAAILFLLLSPLFLRMTNIFLSASSPELRAVTAVNENSDNKFALSILKDKNDFASLFSYGLALKREKRYEESIAVYKGILSSSPQQISYTPEVYVNLGNCYVGLNDMAAAKDFYKKAVEIKPLASAYYNLSQVSRETLDFSKGEEYFLEAVRLDNTLVSGFASISNRTPNRFVIDETLPTSALWEYAGSRMQRLINLSFAVSTAASIALLLLFFIIDSRMKYRAYRCKRCNVILCGKCGKEMLWGQMCSLCYKSLVKLEGLDSRLRIAKLLEVQEFQNRRKNIIKALSFAPPGIAHIYSGKILAGILFLWSFLFFLLLALLNPLFHTGISLSSHEWLRIPSLILMAALYLIPNIFIRGRLSRGWL